MKKHHNIQCSELSRTPIRKYLISIFSHRTTEPVQYIVHTVICYSTSHGHTGVRGSLICRHLGNEIPRNAFLELIPFFRNGSGN